MRCRCEWLVSNLPAVVGPMQQRLSLPPAALEVAALAIVPYRRRMASDCPPSPDLPLVVPAPAPHVVAAVPLKPPARILRANPTVPPPYGERLRGVDAEIIQSRVVALRAQLCCAKPAGGKLAAAVGHVLAAEDAKTQHRFRRQLRQ